jgi:hypothetical protein
MSAQIISGKAIAEDMLNGIKSRISKRLSAGKRAPSLAVILVGGDPASSIYVRNKRLACEKVGIKSIAYDLASDIKESELFALIQKLNDDDTVDGILGPAAFSVSTPVLYANENKIDLAIATGDQLLKQYAKEINAGDNLKNKLEETTLINLAAYHEKVVTKAMKCF